jgi:lipoprotein-releasing system ATP-binding protein
MPDLTVEHVAKAYPTRSGPLSVLRDISLSLSVGENLAILGPSGSGKSTLLYAIGTLDPPTSGTIALRGQNPYTLPEAALARFRNQHIGFVFQDHHLLPQLTVLENVLIPALADGAPSARHQQRARDLLDRVGLTDRLDHRPAELSGGERGRVAVARALVTGPQLVLADEPTGNLDHTNAMAVARLLLRLQQEEQTMLIVVTHSLELANLLQQRKRLDDGRLCEHGESGAP